jgi:hypothetical protein
MDKSYQEQFLAGFLSTAPRNYDYAKDLASPVPWCRPWEGQGDLDEYFNPIYSPFMMGKLYASHYFDFIEMSF